MTLRERTSLSIVLSVLLILMAVLIWAYQTGKVTIFGSEQSHETIFYYQTIDQWQGGEFSHTTFLTYPDFLVGKFVYDTHLKPPFPDSYVRCSENWLDSKCIGENVIIKFTESGGLRPFSESIIFYDNGKVTKEVTRGFSTSADYTEEKFETCYSGEEMAQLISMIDGAGFWQAEENYPTVILDVPIPSLSVQLKDKKKIVTIGPGATNVPEKLRPTFNTISNWPDSRAGRDSADQSCYPQTGWGGYFAGGSYISQPIGSSSVNSFISLQVSSKDLYSPTKEKYKITWQLAGSKDNYAAWSEEKELQSAQCIALVGADCPLTLELANLEQVKDSRYLRVKINYQLTEGRFCIPEESYKCLENHSPLLAGFKIYTTEGGIDVTLPSKPTNLQTQSLGSTSVELSWSASTDSSGIRAYHIYKEVGSIYEEVGSTGNLSYTITDLIANTTYRFYVRAEDGAGNFSDPSDTITITTPAGEEDGGGGTGGQTTPTGGTSTTGKVARLISTGSVLWVNILIALIIAGIITYLMTRKRADY